MRIAHKTLNVLTRARRAPIAIAFAVRWNLGPLGTFAAVVHPDADEHVRIVEAAHRPDRLRSRLGRERSHAIENVD